MNSLFTYSYIYQFNNGKPELIALYSKTLIALKSSG